MKSKTLITTIFFILFCAESYAYEWEIVKVVDGDTIEIRNYCFPKELKLSVRVLGVDTPEKSSRAKCDKEAALAEKATKFTKEFVGKNKTANFTNIKWDKYGGRILADVEIKGKVLKDELINNGFARKYDGGKKQSWCGK